MAAKNSRRKWSQEAKDKRSSDPDVKSQMASIQAVGTAAALSIPEGQRGPQNRESKIWTLIDPGGNKIVVTNLLDWARKNYTLFEQPCDDVDAAANRVAKGFMAIASSLRGVKSRKRPVYHYKDWGLDGFPVDKDNG